MSYLNSIDITNWYLYGQGTKPQDLVTENLIRPSGENPRIYQDVSQYMSSGAGRFAVGASFSVIEQFFNNASIPAGTYTKSELASYFGLNYYGLVIQQSQLDDGRGDYPDRVYIWNTGKFKINDNALFIIEADGTKRIENFSIIPDGNEDFDFVSSSVPPFVNDALRNDIDPSQIGRTVTIAFDGQVPPRTYTFSDYQADLAYKATWTSPSLLALSDAMRGLTNDLWAAGVTRFLDDEDRPILYGTDGDDTLSSIQLQGHYYLGSYVGNGVTEFGGKGSDILRGSPSDDRLNGNSGNDIVQGFVGDDELDGGEGNDFLDGGDDDDEAIYNEIDGSIIAKVLDPSAVPNGVTPNSSPLYELAFTRAGAQETDTLRDVETVVFDDGSTVRLTVQGDLQTSYASTLRLKAGSGSNDVVDLSQVGPVITTIESSGTDEYVKLGQSGLLVNGFEVFIGSSSNDELRAGAGAQTVYSAEGDDILNGGAGDDILEGGQGDDRLEGGADADMFIVGLGYDTIIDADSADRLFVRLSTINGSDPQTGADAAKLVPILGGFFELPGWDPTPQGYTFADMEEQYAVFKPVQLEFNAEAEGQVVKSPLYDDLGMDFSLTFSRFGTDLIISIDSGEEEGWSVRVKDYEEGDLGLSFQEMASPYIIDGVEEWFNQYNPPWEIEHQELLNQGAFPLQKAIYDW
jgi:hypothetical protein